MSDMIDRILSAKTYDRNPYLTLAKGEPGSPDAVTGEYDLKITKAGYNPTSNNLGEMIFVELEVMNSNSERHPVGSVRGWVCGLTKPANLSSAKSFMYAALGADTEEKKAKADAALPVILRDLMAGKPTVLTGREVHCSVVSYMTKDKKNIALNRFSTKR